MMEKPTHATLYMDPIDDYPRRPINWMRWITALALVSGIIAESVFLINLLGDDS